MFINCPYKFNWTLKSFKQSNYAQSYKDSDQIDEKIYVKWAMKIMKLPGISHTSYMHGTLSTFFLGAFVFRLVCYSATNKKGCKMIDDEVPTVNIIWIFDFKCPFLSKIGNMWTFQILIRCLATKKTCTWYTLNIC